MERDEPPIIGTEFETKPPASRGRWWVHLVLLGSYPVVLGLLSMKSGAAAGPLLPRDVPGLLQLIVVEIVLFSALFGLAWFFSRASRDELLLQWRGGPQPMLWGLVGSLGLRLLMAVALALSALAAAVFYGPSPETLEKLRPRIEAVVDANLLLANPLYLLLLLTIVSFVLGGLREELWRAGVLAGLSALFPERFRGFRGQLGAITIAAVLFGLGHLPQGIGGLAGTALLGWGLGLMMIWRRSIWEAVFAHGFFNATSFLLLYYIVRYHPDLLPGAAAPLPQP